MVGKLKINGNYFLNKFEFFMTMDNSCGHLSESWIAIKPDNAIKNILPSLFYLKGTVKVKFW